MRAWETLEVSIPVGFFQALQLAMSGTVDQTTWDVSIPVGFFQALQLVGQPLPESPKLDVSIPVGFFQALQPGDAGGLRAMNGFNPCRVFSGLATLSDTDARWRENAVSIPVGFFQALQQSAHLVVLSDPSGFNPCRVFSGLATST